MVSLCYNDKQNVRESGCKPARIKIVNRFKLSPKLFIGILIAILFGISLIFRVVVPYDQIFVGDWIKFSSIDGYYYMRLFDSFVHNFPNLTTFDPFFIYPGGHGVSGVHFLKWLLAGFAWVIGLGSPTQHTADVVGVYFPAIMGALTVIPVYFIGKTLFNKWAGVIAAALIAILPGEFLGRTILGFSDTPAAEILFTATAMAFLILAIKTAGQRGLTFTHFLKRDRAVIVRPLVYSLLAGIFLGIYLLTWLGGLLFVFIISLYFIIQFIIDHLRRKPSDHLGIVGIILFLVTLIIFLPFSPATYLTVAVVVALFIPLVLAGVSLLVSGRGLKPVYYPLSLIGIGIVFIAIFYAVAPNTLGTMLSKFGLVFAPGGSTATTTLEMQPFLSPQGSFSTLVAWGNFTTSFFLATWWLVPGFCFAAICGFIYHYFWEGSEDKSWLISLSLCVVILIITTLAHPPSEYTTSEVLPIPGFAIIAFIILIWLFIKRRSDDKNWPLFFAWTLVILVATLVQRRFAYYLVINIALLSAYISWQAIWLAGLRKLVTKPEEKPEKEHYYLEATKKGGYYEILGISRSASYREIKKAFRELSSKYNSDLNRTPDTEEKFKEINKAFDVLSNPGKRAGYDRTTREISERKKTKRRGDGQGINMNHINAVLAIIVVFFFVLFPNIVKATEMAPTAQYAPSDAWQESLLWMKENTPEPLGDPDAYYKLYEKPPPGESYNYPESAYGVTSWWDYGYWISRTAHRLPSANPSQSPRPISKVSNIFLSDEESLAEEKMKELESSYVIIDYATCTSKFWAIVNWAGREQEEFIGTYYLPHEGQLIPVQVFLPEYYRTMCVRLYNFDGEAVTTTSPAVITYEEKVDRDGNRYRQINDVQEFSSHQEALDYVESEGSANHSIVGINPFISPIPLEAVQSYKLVYSSESGASDTGTDMIPEVKIFECTGD